MTALRFKGWAALAEAGRLLAAARRETEAAQARERERLAIEQAERELFARSVGAVTRLPEQDRAQLGLPPPQPAARSREADEAQVLLQALSDDFDVDSLLETDDELSFRRPGLPPQLLHKLRRGIWSLQGELDLHGLRSDEARRALGEFLQRCARRGQRCVRVVHGKGHGSPGREGVLRVKVRRWLVQREEVMAFVQATPGQGGAGALIVLLDA